MTFTWLLVYPTALTAQTLSTHQPTSHPPEPMPGEDAELPALLVPVETKLARLHAQL